jgi:hypothetical protein
LGAILPTTYWANTLLLQLAAFWSGPTNTFIFPWGEATVMIGDVATLAGLPLVGCPMRMALPYKCSGRSPKKPSYGTWVKHFLERAPEDPSEARELTEHSVFLSMWLSLFVFSAPPYNVVRREVFPLAVRLASGPPPLSPASTVISPSSNATPLWRREMSHSHLGSRLQCTFSSFGCGNISLSFALIWHLILVTNYTKFPLIQAMHTSHSIPNS